MIPAPPKYMASGIVAALLVAGQVTGQAQGRGAVTPSTAGRAAGASVPAPSSVGPEYRIGPEDVLDIVVWKNPDLSKAGVPVRPDGRISLSVINDVQAAGLTPMELREEITKGLDPFFKDQEVTVNVKEVNSVKISVVGAVRTPNRFQLRSQVTVVDAIAMAGGFADFAKKDKVYVLRNGKRLPFNYDKWIKNPVVRDNFVLLAGDTVVIP